MNIIFEVDPVVISIQWRPGLRSFHQAFCPVDRSMYFVNDITLGEMLNAAQRQQDRAGQPLVDNWMIMDENGVKSYVIDYQSTHIKLYPTSARITDGYPTELYSIWLNASYIRQIKGKIIIPRWIAENAMRAFSSASNPPSVPLRYVLAPNHFVEGTLIEAVNSTKQNPVLALWHDHVAIADIGEDQKSYLLDVIPGDEVIVWVQADNTNMGLF